MSDRSEARWLQALVQSGDDEFQPLDVEALIEVSGRRKRRRTLIVAAATSVTLVACVAVWLPRSGAKELSSTDEHYAAPSTARQDNNGGRTTNRERMERTPRRAGMPPHDAEADIQPESPPLAPAPTETLSPVPPRRGPRSVPKEVKAPPLPTADELLASARAARADRDATAARAALKEVRERFPDSRHSGRATFLLGRVELELAGNAKQAMHWFERYLDEFPSGALAAQARGRILVHLADQEDPGAKAAAAAYLRHHADGPYADLARDLDAGN